MTICRVLGNRKGLVQVKVQDNGEVCWSRLRRSNKGYYLSSNVKSIPAQDILHVCVMKKKTPDAEQPKTSKENTSEKSSTNVLSRSHLLLVHYTVRSDTKELRLGTCKFWGTESECTHLCHQLNQKREEVSGKPVKKDGRKMLVLINPKSGKGKGQEIYNKFVEPYFSVCGITATVIVTTHARHITEIIQSYDFNDFDGVVVLGGDGSWNEAMTGLLLRSMKDAKLDVNNKDNDFIPSSVPLGIVAAGSGSWLTDHIYGTSDPVTHTLHAIRGHRVRLGGMCTHEGKRFLCFSFLVQNIGFVGDIIHSCSVNRWMGPAMYAYCQATSVFKRRLLAGTFILYGSGSSKFITSDVDTPSTSREMDTTRENPASYCLDYGRGETLYQDSSMSSCPDVSNMKSSAQRSEQQSELLDDVKFHNLSMYFTRVMTDKGNFEYSIGHESVHIQLAKKCNLLDFLKHMVKVKDNLPGMLDFPFVVGRNVWALQMTLSSEKEFQKQTWYMNSDGESLPLMGDTYYMRWHPGVIQLFGP